MFSSGRGDTAATVSEWTQVTNLNQVITASGKKVIFDTVRSTGTTGVSIDSAGNISFASGKTYWVTFNLDTVRSNTSASFTFRWHDAAGNLLGAANGASECVWDVGLAGRNSSQSAQMVVLDTSQTYSLRATVTTGTLTMQVPSLLIVET